MRLHPKTLDFVLSALIALPLAHIAYRSLQEADTSEWLRLTGEAGALLMFTAMAIGPASRLLGLRSWWMRWAMRKRRVIGVAAFCYAVLHLLCYLIETETLRFLLAEIGAPGIWTGWLAFILMSLPAASSNDRAMRLLRQYWKPVQRLLYGVVALTVVHWALLMYDWQEPLVHVAPMLLLYGAALIRSVLMTAQKRIYL